jgi:hypothetical protein
MQLQLFLSFSWRHFAILMLARALLRPAKAFVHTFGYRQSISSVVFSSITTLSLEADTVAVHDPVRHVCKYTREAIRYRGQPRGLTALEKLGELCFIRASYDFDKDLERKDQSVLAPQQHLLPSSVTEAFNTQVHVMEQNGWLSTNPDSVDGLPSLHLNLVSTGKSVARQDPLDDFHRGLQKLLAIVEPYIYGELLPRVQEAMRDPSIAVSEVFLRRYGQDIGQERTSRNGISAHYDVFSKVTTVIALDDTAADGTNGLYTTAVSNVQGDHGSTSNHASLRRYFPLKRGDGVVHTWDILHGVDIVPGLNRTSLIVWLTPLHVINSSETSPPPWLVNHPNLETDDIAQFVLASAKEVTDPDVTESPTSPSLDSAMHHDARKSPENNTFNLHPHDLYLKSAAAGNAFALTRLASLSEEKALSQEHAKQGIAILEKLGPLVDTLLLDDDDDIISNDGSISLDSLANRFWLHGAVRGNALAQTALADNMMEKAVRTGNQDLRLLAAVLFGLAAQQGNESAAESLARVVDFQIAHSSIQSQEDFESLPVVRTANAALCAVANKE